MGMDVFGKTPSAEVGKYFRNNLWWWRPLWGYVEEVAPHLTEGVNGQFNDGDGLACAAALQLAAILSEEITSGRTAQYATERDQCLASLPDEPCKLCNGTGTRHDGLAIGRTTAAFPCNGCGGKGMVRPWITEYEFSMTNVAEFRDFVAASGGFEID
jgi:hypothetical protein